MKELKLQKYLRTTNSPLTELEKEFGIFSSRGKKYPNLVLFKYDQICSPMKEEIVQQSRGIILDEADNWKIVARPYDKFFNHGEELATEIDWNTANVFEKLDGTLCTLYFYKDEWHVSTSGVPDASSEVGPHKISFNDLFWKVFKEKNYKLPKDTDRVYMLELMTPLNRVVVKHTENRLVLHGVRYLDGQEILPEYPGWMLGWETVKSYPLRTIDDIVEASKKLDPLETEGYVVTDYYFRRIKIKSPEYVLLHRMIDNVTPRKILELIVLDKIDDFIAVYPEWLPTYQKLSNQLKTLVKEIEDIFLKLASIENQKDFALEAVKHKRSDALFWKRRNPGKSLRDYFLGLNIRSLESILEEKENVTGP